MKLFHYQGIDYKSAKKKAGMRVGFVNFESAEQMKRAMEVSLALLVNIPTSQNLKVTFPARFLIFQCHRSSMENLLAIRF